MAFSIDFLSDILDAIESILSKHGTYGDFVRKYGEQKKDPIISQLKWLYNILMHWFSKDCLKDENVIARLCQTLIETWPWTGANSNFQLLVIKALAFLSEDSVPGKICCFRIYNFAQPQQNLFSMQSNGNMQHQKLSNDSTNHYRPRRIRNVQAETTQFEFGRFGVDATHHIELLFVCRRKNSTDEGMTLNHREFFCIRSFKMTSR